MRKLSAIVAVLCLFSILATPFPLKGQDGVYNTFSGLIWCANPTACLHETAHKMDNRLGWVSDSQDFKDSVKIFILAEARKANPSIFLYKLFAYSDFSNAEIYANIYAWSDGKPENMPEIFRKFYNWELAKEMAGKIK